MTEHLPECPLEVCICSYLRACEARVLDGALEQGYANGKSHGLIDGYEAGYADAALDAAEEWQRGVTAGRVLGYADGLDAAREAVAAAHAADSWTFTDDSLAIALAAIDALREGRQ